MTVAAKTLVSGELNRLMKLRYHVLCSFRLISPSLCAHRFILVFILLI